MQDRLYSLLYDQFSHHRPLAGLKSWQTDQKKLFEKLGLPTHKSETYRHTPLHQLGQVLKTSTSAISRPLPPPPTCFPPLVQQWELSTKNKLHVHHAESIEKLEIKPFSALNKQAMAVLTSYLVATWPSKDPFVALNGALFDNGVWLHIPDHTTLTIPLGLHYLYGAEGSSFAHQRTLITLGEKARLTLVESATVQSENAFWVNHVTQIVLAKGASLQHYNLQTTTHAPTHHMHYTYVQQAANSNFTKYTLSTKGRLLHDHTETTLAGSKSRSNLYGLYNTQDKMHMAHHARVNHQAPDTQSVTHYRGLAQDRSTALFYGYIGVAPIAQHTDAQQLHKGWIITPKARIYAHPQLAIEADEVKCTHGATLQKINLDELHYLQLRGISALQAQYMLINAFLEEVLVKVPEVFVQDYAREQITFRTPQ